jgi:hypothetical protein
MWRFPDGTIDLDRFNNNVLAATLLDPDNRDSSRDNSLVRECPSIAQLEIRHRLLLEDDVEEEEDQVAEVAVPMVSELFASLPDRLVPRI